MLYSQGFRLFFRQVAPKDRFVCRSKNAGCYVQVAATGSVADKLRTFRNLRDRYPCFVITLDQTEIPENTNGVQIIPAVDWLLGKQ